MRPLAIFTAALGMLGLWDASARADSESDRAALRLLQSNCLDAINHGDMSRLAPCLSTDVTIITMTGDEIKGSANLESSWKKAQDLIGPGGRYRVGMDSEQTDFYGNLAVSRGTTKEVVRLPDGREMPFTSYWTAICRKDDGAWKAVRVEATMNPVDNVFIALQLQKNRTSFGIGGFVIGMVLTLAIRGLRRGGGRDPASAPYAPPRQTNVS